jgi:hypothetical protein
MSLSAICEQPSPTWKPIATRYNPRGKDAGCRPSSGGSCLPHCLATSACCTSRKRDSRRTTKMWLSETKRRASSSDPHRCSVRTTAGKALLASHPRGTVGNYRIVLGDTPGDTFGLILAAGPRVVVPRRDAPTLPEHASSRGLDDDGPLLREERSTRRWSFVVQSCPFSFFRSASDTASSCNSRAIPLRQPRHRWP